MFAFVLVRPEKYKPLYGLYLYSRTSVSYLWVGMSLSRCCESMYIVFGVFECVACSNLVCHVRRIMCAMYSDLGCAVMGVLKWTYYGDLGVS